MDLHRAAVTLLGRRGPRWLLTALPAGFLLVFFVWPLAAIVGRGASADAIGDVLRDDRLRAVLWFTFWQAAVSTVLTVAVALPGAWVLARHRFPGRSVLRAAITVPFVLPTVVVATAFVAVLGPGGVLGGLGLHPGVGAILVAHVFFNYAVVARTVGNALAHVDPTLEDAARVLGAGRWRVFREVSLPLVRPAVVAATSIVFLFTFTSFGVVLLLGGSRRATLEVEIWRETTFFLDLRAAAALAVIQLVTVAVCLLVFGRFQENPSPQRPRAATDVARRPVSAFDRLFLVSNVAVMALLLGGPVAVLVHRSIDTGDGLGLRYYRALTTSRRGTNLFVAPWDAVRNSVTFALVAMGVALVVGVSASFVLAERRGRAARGFDTLLMLPLGTSAVTLGFGFLIALDEPPLDLRQSRWLIPVAHALVAIPFVVRIVLPAIRAIDPRLREAAAVLGAGPGRARLEVDLPLVARAVLVAGGFAFAVSLGEFGATVFLARPDVPTMPVAIFRFLAQPGALNAGQAMAMSTVLMVVTATVMLVIERFRVGSIGTF